MISFHQHPDGLVFVRMEAGVYCDTLANFTADYGQDITLPAGSERYYEPGQRHVINGEPQALEWPPGDWAIADFEKIKANKLIRVTPPPLTAAEETALELARQYAQAVEQTVDILRPTQYANFLTADQDDILAWIEANGSHEAFWGVIQVLRYLVACKDRDKLHWAGA